MNFRGCMCETKIIFCILGRMDGINVEVSMNPNDQCGLYKVKALPDRTAHCSRHGTDN